MRDEAALLVPVIALTRGSISEKNGFVKRNVLFLWSGQPSKPNGNPPDGSGMEESAARRLSALPNDGAKNFHCIILRFQRF